jgi:phage terminase large subunit
VGEVNGVITIDLGQPQPKQIEFLEATAKYVGYGGSRGGGKSWVEDFKATIMALVYPGIKQMIVRRSYPELNENHIIPLRKKLMGVARYNDKEKSLFFENGSRIKFSYCANAGDELQYNGQEWDVVYIDEAQQLSESAFNAIKATIRGVNEFPKRLYATANPGGIGMAWYRRLFIERDFREGENPEDYVFIQALVTDNEILMQSNPDYIKQLESLPPAQRAAWRYGDWYSYEGRFFSEFRGDIHVIEPIPLPKHYRRYRAIDYGLDMLAVLWMAVDDMGNEYIYRELHLPNIIAPDAARMIAEASVYDDGTPEEITSTFAPPDLWSRTKDSGRSIADLFAEGGVRFTKASAERINGWMMVKDHIKPIPSLDGEGETSRLKIFRNCVNLIKNIQLLEFDDKRPSDASTEPHEITHICLTGDTVVRTPRGNMRLDEMDENGVILAYSDGEIVEAEYDHLGVTNAYASVYAMELDNGEVIRATENHPFLTEDGYKALEDLNEGDTLVNADGGVNEIVLINYDGHEAVYNMSVDLYHNFITEGGTVTHNCDALRYMCVMRTLPAKPEPKEMTRAEWLQKAKQKAIYKRR